MVNYIRFVRKREKQLISSRASWKKQLVILENLIGLFEENFSER